jgi:predicted ATPase
MIELQITPEVLLATTQPPPQNFTGRKQQIKKIVEELTAPNSNGVIALIGMGGIGKTATAKQIADTVKLNFPGGIFWGDELSYKDANPSTILKEWARLCGQNLEKESDENLPSIVRGLLAARKIQKGAVLAIIDDVRLDWQNDGIKTIQRALPVGIPLLITTRLVQVAQEIGAKIYRLNVLSRLESCQLLSSISEKRISGSDAKKIAELCGDMPLALELIANLAKTRESSWLLERLQGETNRLNVLKDFT